MSRCQLRIELLSDLCVSDGGVYNSALDTDICYDRYGFPVIPARRIRGCLRECGLELCDWGKDIPIRTLFGDKGADSNRARVRIGDAYPENYEELVREVKASPGNLVFHPQNVLNHFSYVRTQTSLDYGTGIADPTTLRTMRVANRGLVFLSDTEVEDGLFDALEACCKAFTHMGIGRTRGLGEVRVTLTRIPTNKHGEEMPEEPEETGRKVHAPYVEGAVRLDYELNLKEPVICKSTNGGESRSLDYIEGSKMLGLIAQELKKAGVDFVPFMDGSELFCSNAYLSKDGERCLEVPANYYTIKNEDSRYVEKGFTDELPVELNDVQLNMMKHCYVRRDSGGSLIREGVCMEERYHHRRPEDKSIGRAAAEDSGESGFYQMSSIEAGQSFRGYVTGTAEQIQKIYDCLSALHNVCIGYSHSSEYGKTGIRIISLSTEEPERTVTASDFSVKLEAPALIYNSKAFYSTDVMDLDAEIRSALGIPETAEPAEPERFGSAELERRRNPRQYVKYVTLGGYNVTWNARKPTVEAFDKGTVLYYHFSQPVKLRIPGQILLGERVSEGFGEATVHMEGDISEPCRINLLAESRGKVGGCLVCADPGTLAADLCDELFIWYVRMKAVSDVKNLPKGDVLRNASKARPTVSNMILICQENTGMQAIDRIVKERYGKKSEQKEEKLAVAGRILDQAEKNSSELLDAFCREYQVTGYKMERDRYVYQYLKSFLQQLKYIFRVKEAGKQKEEA